VFALTKIGRFMVGTLFTVPASVGAAVGGAPDRLIGYAYSPGARAWAIRATGPNPTGGDISRGPLVSTNVSADLKASPVQCCFGAGVGVFYAQGRLVPTGGPLAASRVDAVTPARLATITANAPGTNTIETWLMLFNSAVVPGAGAVPFLPTVPLDLDPGTTGQASYDPALFFPNGIAWGLSSTPDVFTPVLAPNVVRVVTNQEW
jgi:hypothetical protein